MSSAGRPSEPPHQEHVEAEGSWNHFCVSRLKLLVIETLLVCVACGETHAQIKET